MAVFVLKLFTQVVLLVVASVFLAGQRSAMSSAFTPPSPSIHRFQCCRGVATLTAFPPPAAAATTTTQLKDVATDAVGGVLEAVVDSATGNPHIPLMEYFLKAVIDSAVPSLFTIATIGLAALIIVKATRGGKNNNNDNDMFGNTFNPVEELYNDLYGSSTSNRSRSLPFGGFGGAAQNNNKQQQLRNIGIPATEYLQITQLNDKYASYDFSLTKATTSKAAAAAQFREQAFSKALGKALQTTTSSNPIPASTRRELLQAEQTFLLKGQPLVAKLQALQTNILQDNVKSVMDKMGGVENLILDAKIIVENDNNNNATSTQTNETAITSTTTKSTTTTTTAKLPNTKELVQLQNQLLQLEMTFVQDVLKALGPERAMGLQQALMGDMAVRGPGGLLRQVESRPLSAMFGDGNGNDDATKKKSLFVMKFPGDVTASQLNELREEVTAIVRNAQPGEDEALLILQSGGGTVTGYGLAAGQLVRLKNAGIRLTIAVEQVAASGGYMMSCVADKIVASPFAVLGSIGVISETPNVYDRLKQEGIEFQTVTAGEFKRTITPTKKITKEDVKKAKEDVEMILTQFAAFVQKNRPMLDVQSVATGETWFGEAALEKGLCDEIKPVDDVLLDYVNEGYNVYEIAYRPPPQVPAGLAGLLQPAGSSGSSNNNNNIGRKAIRWLVNSVRDEVQSAIREEYSLDETNKYMVQDDTADRMQIKEDYRL